MSCGKLFHTLVAAAANVLSPKLLQVRLTASVRVSTERSFLARTSVTSWQSADGHMTTSIKKKVYLTVPTVIVRSTQPDSSSWVDAQWVELTSRPIRMVNRHTLQQTSPIIISCCSKLSTEWNQHGPMTFGSKRTPSLRETVMQCNHLFVTLVHD